MTLTERLLALAKEWAPQCTNAADISADQKEYMDAYIESAFETIFPMVARMALDEAAKECVPKDGYCTCDSCDNLQKVEQRINRLRDQLGNDRSGR